MGIAEGTSSDKKLLAVTYIGTHKFGFYRDCRESATRLEKSLEKFGVPLIRYDLKSILGDISFLDGKFLYLFTRYGAGAWFWKAIVIKKVLKETVADQIIYLDSDCVVTKDPRTYISSALAKDSVAIFAQKMKMEMWISRRASSRLRLSPSTLSEADLLTAGIIILRNDSRARSFLNSWDMALTDPSLLLSPLFNNRQIRHRHDQSILSGLYAKGMIQCKIIRDGFYSVGLESASNSLAESWVYTGQLETITNENLLSSRISLFLDYRSRQFYELIKSICVTPIQIVLYRLFVVLHRGVSRTYE